MDMLKRELGCQLFKQQQFQRIYGVKVPRRLRQEIEAGRTPFEFPEFAGQTFIVSQPFSTQISPDLLVVLNGMVFCVEQKSCKKGHYPKWNSGKPIKNIIYILTLMGGNCMFLGQDLMSKEEWDLALIHHQQILDLTRRQTEDYRRLGSKWKVTARDDRNLQIDYYERAESLNTIGRVKSFIKYCRKV